MDSVEPEAVMDTIVDDLISYLS